MELTRIEEENRHAFSAFLPEGIVAPEDTVVGVISDEGFPMAAAAFAPTESGAMLKWIATDPEERRKGAAMLILHDALIRLAAQIPVLTASFPEGTEGIGELLEHMGFTVTEGDPVYEITVGELFNDPAVLKLAERSFGNRLIPLSKADARQKESLRKFLKEQAGGDVFLRDIDPEYSFMTETAEIKIVGCLLTKKIGNDLLVELLLNVEPGDVDQLLQALTMKLLREKVKTKLCFVAAEPKIEQFADRITKDKTVNKRRLNYAVFPMR